MARQKARSKAASIASELTVTVMQQHPTQLRTSNDVGEFFRATFAVVLECIDGDEEDAEE